MKKKLLFLLGFFVCIQINTSAGSNDGLPIIISEIDPTVSGFDSLEFIELFNFSTTETVDLANEQVHLVRYLNNSQLSFSNPIALEGTIGPGEYFIAGGSDVDNVDFVINEINIFPNQEGAVALFQNLNPNELPANTFIEDIPLSATIVDSIIYRSRLDFFQGIDPNSLGQRNARLTPYEYDFPSSADFSIQRDVEFTFPQDFNPLEYTWDQYFVSNPSPGVVNSELTQPITLSIEDISEQFTNPEFTIADEVIITSGDGPDAVTGNVTRSYRLYYLESENFATQLRVLSGSDFELQIGEIYTGLTGLGTNTVRNVQITSISDQGSLAGTQEPVPVNYDELPQINDVPFNLRNLFRYVFLEDVKIDTTDSLFFGSSTYNLVDANNQPLDVRLNLGSANNLSGENIPQGLVTIRGILAYLPDVSETELFDETENNDVIFLRNETDLIFDPPPMPEYDDEWFIY